MNEMDKLIENPKKIESVEIPSPAEAYFLENLREEENFLGMIRNTLKKNKK